MPVHEVTRHDQLAGIRQARRRLVWVHLSHRPLERQATNRERGRGTRMGACCSIAETAFMGRRSVLFAAGFRGHEPAISRRYALSGRETGELGLQCGLAEVW